MQGLIVARGRSQWQRDAVAVAGLVAVVCIFWWRLLLLRGYLALDDMSLQNTPLAAMYSRALAQGRLPLWVEAFGAGFPLHAEGQIGALYPLNLALFSLCSFLTALNLGTVLHGAIAATFTYALGRRMLLSRPAAVLAGSVFALSSLMVTSAPYVNIIRVMAWLPLLILCIDRATEADRPWRWIPAIAGVSGIQWLAGHPQMTLFSAALGIGYAVFAAIAQRRGRARTALVALCVVAAALAGGALLAAAQTAPSAGLYPLTSREYKSALGENLAELLPASHLLAFLLPGVFGSPTTGTFAGPSWLFSLWSCYLGGVALMLAAAAVRRGASWRVWCWLCLAGAALAVAVLPYPTLLFSHLPFLAGMRFWPRTLWLVAPAVSLLAGAGLDAIMGSDRLARRAQIACGVLAALVAAAGAASLARGYLSAYFRQAEPWLTVGALGLAGAALWLHRVERIGRLATVGVLLGLNVVLLFQFGQPYQPLVDRQFYASPPWTAVAAAATPGKRVFSRYVPHAADRGMIAAHREALSKDWPALYGLRSLQAYTGLPLLRPALFTSALLEIEPPADAPIWRVTNVGTIIASRYSNAPTDQTVVERATVPTPRAWLAEGVRRVDAPVEALGLLVVQGLRAVTVEAPPAAPLPEGIAPGAGWARVIRAGDMEVALETHSRQPALLVLADTWCPGWHAFVNGREAPIRPADVMFRGVVVPPGDARVRFVYEPAGVRVGLWITLAALAALACWGAAVALAGPRRDRADGPNEIGPLPGSSAIH